MSERREAPHVLCEERKEGVRWSAEIERLAHMSASLTSLRSRAALYAERVGSKEPRQGGVVCPHENQKISTRVIRERCQRRRERVARGKGSYVKVGESGHRADERADEISKSPALGTKSGCKARAPGERAQ